MGFHVHHRILVPVSTLEAVRPHLERTEDRVWLSRTESCLRYTIRGVPARLIDVCLTELPVEPPFEREWTDSPDLALVVEVGRKAGRFDGAERWTVNLRRWNRRQRVWEGGESRGYVFDGSFHLLVDDAQATAVLTWQEGPGGRPLNHPLVGDRRVTRSWAEVFGRLKSDLSSYDLPSVVGWHASRYYRHLDWDDVRALSEAFEAMHPGIRSLTLAEANRMASRDLYRLSRDRGWRKLSLKDRKKYALDGVQWVRQDFLLQRHLDMGFDAPRNASGAGDYSLQAAAGWRMYPTLDGDEDVPGEILHDMVEDGLDVQAYLGGDPEV